MDIPHLFCSQGRPWPSYALFQVLERHSELVPIHQTAQKRHHRQHSEDCWLTDVAHCFENLRAQIVLQQCVMHQGLTAITRSHRWINQSTNTATIFNDIHRHLQPHWLHIAHCSRLINIVYVGFAVDSIQNSAVLQCTIPPLLSGSYASIKWLWARFQVRW